MRLRGRTQAVGVLWGKAVAAAARPRLPPAWALGWRTSSFQQGSQAARSRARGSVSGALGILSSGLSRAVRASR
jgi:hypothetical protein